MGSNTRDPGVVLMVRTLHGNFEEAIRNYLAFRDNAPAISGRSLGYLESRDIWLSFDDKST